MNISEDMLHQLKKLCEEKGVVLSDEELVFAATNLVSLIVLASRLRRDEEP